MAWPQQRRGFPVHAHPAHCWHPRMCVAPCWGACRHLPVLYNTARPSAYLYCHSAQFPSLIRETAMCSPPSSHVEVRQAVSARGEYYGDTLGSVGALPGRCMRRSQSSEQSMCMRMSACAAMPSTSSLGADASASTRRPPCSLCCHRCLK